MRFKNISTTEFNLSYAIPNGLTDLQALENVLEDLERECDRLEYETTDRFEAEAPLITTYLKNNGY